MKKSIKRLSALLLTLCMLASLMVPVAFANTETETPSVDAAETYQIRVKDLTNTDPTITDGIEGLFTDGTSFINNAVNKVISKTSGFYDTYGWKFYAVKDSLGYRYDQMYMARLGYNDWAALQINVSEAGLYALNLKTDKTVDTETESTPWTNASSAWTGDVSAYIIPLADVTEAVASATATETETAEVVAINGLMTDEYSVGTVNMAADVDNITFAKTRMEAGEYVVVYAAVGNFAISEMSLLETAADAAKYEMVDVETYPIRLSDPASIPTTEPGTWVLKNGAYNSTNLSTLETNLSDAYAAGDLNWKYLASNTASASNVILRKNVNMMLRINKSTDNSELTALQIKVPQSGTYALTVGTDRTAAYEATGLTNALAALAFNITAYLVNVNDLEAAVTADNIASLAIDANCVGTAALAADASSGMFNRTFLEAGEYVLIFKTGTSNAAISEFTLAQRAYEVLPENEEVVVEDITYKFDLYNNERYAPVFLDPADGSLENRNFASFALTGLEGVYEAGEIFGDILLNDYNNGLLNWKNAGTNLSSFTFEPNNNGLRFQNKTADAQYGALCLNVPATAFYTVNVVGASNDADVDVYLYDADAEGDVAANMTDANLVGSLATGTTNLLFSKMLTEGEYIIAFKVAGITGTSTKETFKLNSIVLSVNNDPSTISFDLSTNEAYQAAVVEKANGAEIAFTWGSGANLNKIEYTDADGATQSVYPYSVLATMFKNGQIDWAMDYTVNTNAAPMKHVHPYAGSLRLRMKDDGTGYAGIRLRIKNAGLQNVTVNAVCEGDTLDAYLVPAETAYTTFGACTDLSSYMIEANKLGSAVPVSATTPVAVTGTYNVDEAGEYILILTSNSNIFLSSVDLEPITAAAYADGVAYTSFEAALAKATESVVLNENVAADEVIVPAGVSLDLNGYALYATSVDAKTAPGAEIIDSSDGKGLVRGEVEFAENNAQLPLCDVEADGYRLFKVDVNAVTTTGSGNATKYWFKVNFSNSDVFELIGANTELRIMADMTGVYSNKVEDLAGQAFAAEATAPVSFTNAWAAKNTSYIVVSAVGSSGVDSFQLFPAVTANGVVISGDAMTKG